LHPCAAVWKTWYHLAFAAVFFVTIALCISCGGIIVSLVLYIKQAAQESALLVSTGAAVANTRRHLSSLNRLFVVSYASFALSAVLAHRMGRGTSGKKHLHRARATAHGSTARDSESGRRAGGGGGQGRPARRRLPLPPGAAHRAVRRHAGEASHSVPGTLERERTTTRGDSVSSHLEL